MSFYGINSAAINGGITSVNAGAAHAASVSNLYAEGTRIQHAAVDMAGASDGIATGTRIVMATVEHNGKSSLFAQWSIISDVKITMKSSGSLRATPTDLYMPASSGFTLEPTLIQPGAVDMAGLSSLPLDPVVTVAGFTEFAGNGALIIDPGVKLSGTTLVQRDGRAAFDSTAQLSATGVRTALSSVELAGGSSFVSVYTYVHGGEANMLGVSGFIAAGTTEFANFDAESNFTANGSVTQFSSMSAQASSSFAAERSVVTQGKLLPAVLTSQFSAAGRLAARSSATFANQSTLRVDPRLAIQGAAFIGAVSGLDLDVTVTIPADTTTFNSTSSLDAEWVVLQFGKATFAGNAQFQAIGRTNIQALDPPERTMNRPYTDREMRRPFIAREMRRTA